MLSSVPVFVDFEALAVAPSLNWQTGIFGVHVQKNIAFCPVCVCLETQFTLHLFIAYSSVRLAC